MNSNSKKYKGKRLFEWGGFPLSNSGSPLDFNLSNYITSNAANTPVSSFGSNSFTDGWFRTNYAANSSLSGKGVDAHLTSLSATGGMANQQITGIKSNNTPNLNGYESSLPTASEGIGTGWVGPVVQIASAGINAANAAVQSNQPNLDKYVFGDTTADPIANFIKMGTGAYGKEAANQILGQQQKFNINSSQQALDAWDQMNFFDASRYRGYAAGGDDFWSPENMKATMRSMGSIALGTPWIDFNKRNGSGNYGKFSLGNIAASAQGAAYGSAAGPWGALGGAALGMLVNKFTEPFYGKNAKSVVDAMDLVNSRNLASYNLGYNNYVDLNTRNMEKDYAIHGAYGGKLGLKFPDINNGVVFFDTGDTHENNPLGGIPQGVDDNGVPNLVEEGEVKYKDYVFSNRLAVPKAVRNKYKLRGETFAEAFTEAQRESEERPNDPISKNGLESMAFALMEEQEGIKQQKDKMKKGNKFEWGGATELMRTAPIWANFGAVLADSVGATNKPIKYDNLTPPKTIEFSRLGDYAPETVFDTRYALSQNRANDLAARRALLQSSTPNVFANMLARSYLSNISNGELYRKAQEYNYDTALKRREFNRGTNQFNATGIMDAAKANAANMLDYQTRLNNQLKMTEDSSNDAYSARAANISGLAEGISGFGKEQEAKEWRNALADSDVFGTLSDALKEAIRMYSKKEK